MAARNVGNDPMATDPLDQLRWDLIKKQDRLEDQIEDLKYKFDFVLRELYEEKVQDRRFAKSFHQYVSDMEYQIREQRYKSSRPPDYYTPKTRTPIPANKFPIDITFDLVKLDPVPCHFCKQDLYREANKEIFVFEKLNTSQTMATDEISCDSNCFKQRICLPLADDFPYNNSQAAFIKNPTEPKSCFHCLEKINSKESKEIVSYFSIKKHKITNSSSQIKTMLGKRIRFCCPCWESLAGPGFFETPK